MGLSRTVSEINGDFSQKSQIFPTRLYFAPPLKGSPWNWVLFQEPRKIVLPSIFDTSFSSLMTWNFQSYPKTVLNETSCAVGRHNMPPPPVTLTFDLLTLKMVSESHVTCATSVLILVFLGLSVLDLGPMYATDDRRQTDRLQTASSLYNAPPRGRRHNNMTF